jgi:hypothetical protein
MKRAVTKWTRDQDQIEHHCASMVPLTDMLCILLAQPDAETAIDGMHAVLLMVADHARAIREINAQSQTV